MSQIATPMSVRDWLGSALIILPMSFAFPPWGAIVGTSISYGVHVLVGVGRESAAAEHRAASDG